MAASDKYAVYSRHEGLTALSDKLTASLRLSIASIVSVMPCST